MQNSSIMRKLKQVIYAFAAAGVLLLSGCDKDFVEINTDPFAITKLDPALLFAGAQRTYTGGWESENTIVQQFVVPYNEGATLGFNFNEDIDGQQTGSWNQYTGAIKHFVHILNLLDGTTDRVNLQSMVRIWKVQVMMDIVDHYGDVPYSQAGLAAIKGEEFFFPKYDNDEEIYEDLYTELTDAISKLDPAGDFVSADLFYGLKAKYPTQDAAAQVAKWKKLGNSLLLRLGMRYSKVDPAKAQSIVAEAFNGGVMTSNNDNAFVVYDGTLYTNTSNNNLVNNNPRFYYAAEPFVNQLKSTNDPRAKYMIARYANPNDPEGDENPIVALADQYGLPVGIPASSLTVAPYRGAKQGGYDYSQMNVSVVASLSAPTFWVTYAQTSLLLAEAAHRGWIAGGEAAAQTYYEAGIKADMDVYALYLSETDSNLPAITAAEKDAYLAQPAVAYNSANAYQLINTAYWIVNLRNGAEAFANFRRSGYPALQRNAFDNRLLDNGGDGFIHRFSYPDAELSRNKVNYQDAVQAMGGIDNNIARVFWDVPVSR
jgi:hypothetical protein